MVFSSATFLFILLPVVIILHSVIPNIRVKNALLILASLVFYSFGEPVYVGLLVLSICINYLLGRVVKRNKIYLTLAIIVNLLMLVIFKYAGFLAELVNLLPFVNLPVPDVHMPIGISFFTFQALSYVIDTYRSEKDEKADFFDVMLYICLFPQLVAGPIVKYNSVREKLKDRYVSAESMSAGIKTFIIGLSKKMLIANAMAVSADKMFALSAGELDTFASWVGATSYMLQIYFDFSGYSDMAVGMGRMFGFEFPENFNYPYIASSIRDFWKRWHISLTSWFREYLYIPMGGNRKGKIRTIFNRFFVFVCTGVWHGANLTFVAWGIYHGLLTAIESVFDEKNANNTVAVKENIVLRIVKHIYTILAVMIGFVIFRADTLVDAGRFIKSMFTFNTTFVGTMTAMSVLTPIFIFITLLAIIFSTPILKKVPANKVTKVIGMVITLFLYVICIMEIAQGSYNPFIYFRF